MSNALIRYLASNFSPMRLLGGLATSLILQTGINLIRGRRRRRDDDDNFFNPAKRIRRALGYRDYAIFTFMFQNSEFEISVYIPYEYTLENFVNELEQINEYLLALDRNNVVERLSFQILIVPDGDEGEMRTRTGNPVICEFHTDRANPDEFRNSVENMIHYRSYVADLLYHFKNVLHGFYNNAPGEYPVYYDYWMSGFDRILSRATNEPLGDLVDAFY